MKFAIFKRKKYYSSKYNLLKPSSNWKYVEGTRVETKEKAKKKLKILERERLRYGYGIKVEYRMWELDDDGNRILDPPPEHILRMYDQEVYANGSFFQ